LKKAGVLQETQPADGVYGGMTRSSIAEFQRSEGMLADGLMSNVTAERLLRRAGTGESPVIASISLDTTRRTQLAELQQRYEAIIARADELDAQQARRAQLKSKIAEAKRAIDDALKAGIRSELRDQLQGLAAKFDQLDPDANDDRLSSALAEFQAVRASIESSVAIARATTGRNAFVTQGNLSDVVVLFNDTGKAPSVIKNLRGDIVFEGQKVAACQPHRDPMEATFSRELNTRFRKWDQQLTFPLPRCAPAGLASNDLVIFARGALLKESPSDLVTVLSAIDSGAFAPMFTVSEDDVKAAAQQDALQLLEIESNIEAAASNGFGIAALNAASSGAVCQIIDEDRHAHETLLRRQAARLTEELKATPTFSVTSAETAFIGAKRGQCAAVYGSGERLRDLVRALRRDQIAFRYLPVWISRDEIEGERSALAQRQARDEQQKRDRERRREDEKRLEIEREKESGADKRRRQEQLQRQYGAMARAFESTLAGELKDYLEGRSDRAAVKYPAIRDWYEAQKRDRWELMTIDTVLQDCGTAEFKGRPLELAFAATTIKMRNRILGEYRETCFVTGFISDTEFEMARETFSTGCGNRDSLQSYQLAQRFSSRWLVP